METLIPTPEVTAPEEETLAHKVDLVRTGKAKVFILEEIVRVPFLRREWVPGLRWRRDYRSSDISHYCRYGRAVSTNS